MNMLDSFKRIAIQYPKGDPKITEFSSGAIMLDLTIQGERYCIEYLPSKNIIGLSKIKGSSPFWDGVDKSFESLEELEQTISEMMGN